MWDSIMNYCEQYGAISLFVMMFSSSFGAPFSKTLAMVAGGFLSATGRGNPLVLFMALALGLHCGDFAMYGLGRQIGPGLFDSRFFSRVLPKRLIPKAQGIIDKHGLLSLAVVRFLPFVRTICYVLLGTLKMNILKFNLINFPVTAFYVSLFFLTGYFLGQHPEQLMLWLKRGNMGFAIFGSLMLVFAFLWLRRRSRLAAVEVMETT